MRTLDDLLSAGVGGTAVLVRADLNVPLDAGRITDDGRIRAVLPTVRQLTAAGARVILLSHLGRPKGQPDPKYTLKPVSVRLGELLETQVAFATDTVGESAKETVAALENGGVALLENLRFDARETSKDEAERGAFATELAAFGESYVDDAFGAVHRKHASVFDLARKLPHYAGNLVAAELEVLRKLTTEPARPYVVVLGGSKVSDKLGVIQALLPKVDRLLVGGGMCFTFLKAQGKDVGDSLLEDDQVEVCRQLLAEAGDKIVLPVDVVVSGEIAPQATTRIVGADEIPDKQKGLDIGPASVAVFADVLKSARTVFWNGPMGVFEVAPFAAGTRGVGEAVRAVDGLSVVGGGDSAAAVRLLELGEDAFGHISTGGGASLEYLEGKTLPGLEALED
ncbi:phosphoglycerate kinase [Fodinicola acaciae]|uniref:phosphoglycerate kinase n=1 Tax=Fodinicola acaciae TaxID=2681555 RepID=UPI0013D41D52|nr:phosphoglycerate kinase [Fodinicola acaciae]